MMAQTKIRGTTLIEIVVSMGLLFLLVLALNRYFTETSLPQQAMIRQFTVGIHLAEKILNLLAGDIAGGREPVPVEGDSDLTVSLLEHPMFQDDLRQLCPTLQNSKEEIRIPFRAGLQVRHLQGRPTLDQAGKEIPGHNGPLISLLLKLEWGGEPSHRLSHGLMVLQP